MHDVSLSSSTPGAVPLDARVDGPPGVRANAPDSVGRRIARLRKARQWTQADLARRLGVSETSVCYWEQDRSRPRAARLQSLAALFDTPVAGLIGHDASNGASLGDMVARMRAEIAYAAGTTPAKVKIVIEI